MTITIIPVSPRDIRAAALLRAGYALMQQMFGPEDNLSLDVDALCAPSITVFAAQRAGDLLGCIALKRADRYGEIKSFFVSPEARGLGVGRLLLQHLVSCARAEGLGLLRLETGVGLDAAQALYRAEGFVPCGPFGAYADTGASLFYERPLSSGQSL